MAALALRNAATLKREKEPEENICRSLLGPERDVLIAARRGRRGRRLFECLKMSELVRAESETLTFSTRR